jgi:DNA-binding NarL/FixJ family response regulator
VGPDERETPIRERGALTKQRVFLADDHAIVLDGMRAILEPDYEVVGEAKDGRALVEAAVKLRPDVIVADIAMPILNGLEAVRQLQKADLRAKIIIMTMHASVEFAVQAFRLGVSGYLLKHDASDELIRAIREVLNDRFYVTPGIAKDVMISLMEGQKSSDGDDEPWAKLTNREREVLQLVAEGRKMTEIAKVLKISSRTVERHKYNLMDKLSLRTTAELTQYAIKRGVISPP